MEYKGIKYSIYPDYEALQCEQYGDYDVGQVLRTTKFVELAGHLKPANFIVERRNAQTPPDSFISFLEERIFVELQEYGVKRIFYVLSEKELNAATKRLTNIPSFVTLCGKLSDVFEILDKEKIG